MEGLPIRLNLCKRGIITIAKCPLCEKVEESTSHALIYCEKNWDVWWNWHDCPISLFVGNKTVVDVALQILVSGTIQDLETFCATAWSIWYRRNQVIHESFDLPPSQVWATAQRNQKDYKGAMVVHQVRQKQLEGVDNANVW